MPKLIVVVRLKADDDDDDDDGLPKALRFEQ